MIITVATPSDLDALAGLERDAFVDRRWSRAAWAEAVSSARGQVLVARDPVAVGVIALTVVEDVADLDRLAVDTAHRRSGIGDALLSRGLTAVRAAGAQRVLLEVENTNAAARALYTARGFVDIGTRRHYYGPGRDAVIMERTWNEGTA
ncbi:MAG: GNAT family N-acetyltransferase [Propioniciclava sp.]